MGAYRMVLTNPLTALISKHASGRVVAATPDCFYTQVDVSLEDIVDVMETRPWVVFAEIEDATCVAGFDVTPDMSDDFFAARDMADQMRDIMRAHDGDIEASSAVCDSRFRQLNKRTP